MSIRISKKTFTRVDSLSAIVGEKVNIFVYVETSFFFVGKIVFTLFNTRKTNCYNCFSLVWTYLKYIYIYFIFIYRVIGGLNRSKSEESMENLIETVSADRFRTIHFSIHIKYYCGVMIHWFALIENNFYNFCF